MADPQIEGIEGNSLRGVYVRVNYDGAVVKIAGAVSDSR